MTAPFTHRPDPVEAARLIVTHDAAHAFSAVVPPIVQTSLFTFASYDEMVAAYRGEITRPMYSRGLNPTVRMFEEMLAELEGAEDALGFASGMAAISAAVLSFVAPGDRVRRGAQRLSRRLPALRHLPAAHGREGRVRRRPRPRGGRGGAAGRAAPLPRKPDELADRGARRRRAGGARPRARHPVGDRQQLGDADLPEPAGARRRPRGAFGVEVHRRPQRRGGRRRGGLDARSSTGCGPSSTPTSAAGSRPFDAWLLDPRPAHAAGPDAGAPGLGARDRPPAGRAPRGHAGEPPRPRRAAARPARHLRALLLRGDGRASTCAPSATPCGSSSSA